MRFKVGDRVAAYLAGTIEQPPFREVGRVVNIDHDELKIRVDEGKTGEAVWWVNKKQCRKLVKRKRRQWTLGRSPRTGEWIVFAHGYQFGQDEPPAEIVDVVEVKRRKGK